MKKTYRPGSVSASTHATREREDHVGRLWNHDLRRAPNLRVVTARYQRELSLCLHCSPSETVESVPVLLLPQQWRRRSPFLRVYRYHRPHPPGWSAKTPRGCFRWPLHLRSTPAVWLWLRRPLQPMPHSHPRWCRIWGAADAGVYIVTAWVRDAWSGILRRRVDGADQEASTGPGSWA